MNKTRQRAIQKHRAKKAKFELRRAATGEQNGNRQRTTAAPAPAPSKTRSSARRTAGSEVSE
jgi:hypothetical protein